jgi:hypothetical protein
MITTIFIKYPRFKPYYHRFKNRQFTLLDVGCGNHSPSETKKVFKNVIYHGLDKTNNYNNTSEDIARIDRFFQIDLDKDSLTEISNNFYDVILMCHIVEHLKKGTDVLAQLTSKLKKGGVIYVEFPSVHSLELPSMKGTLNFCDDLTHVRIYDIKELANILLQNNCKIIRAGTRRDPIRLIAFPFMLLRGLLRRSPASAFWDLMGFADYIYATRE